MKAQLLIGATLGLLVLALQSPLRAADADEERQLIQVLQSGRSPAEKDAACARLKRIGTVQAVPALAALLTDEQLSHSARYVLESMPAPEAGQALAEAVGKTAGMTRIGLLDSLGFRGELQAAPVLVRSLADAEAGTAEVIGYRPTIHVRSLADAEAAAAAAALGKIGGPEALAALASAAGDSARSAPVHEAVVDALLRCAHRLLAAGDLAKARPIFARLYQAEKKDYVLLAAYRGMILASAEQGLSLMVEAIADKPGPRQGAALQLVREFQAPAATAAFARLLPKLEPPVRVALVEGLGQRHDVAAAPALAPLVRDPSPEVRLAAINALGLLGDAGSVPVLAEAAASTAGPELEAARQALIRLPDERTAPEMLARLATAPPAVQAELARALGERGEVAAVPKLLALAQQGPDSARSGALQALALLAGPPQMEALVSLVLEAKSDSARAQAAEALQAAFQRLQAKHGHVDAAPLVTGLAASSTKARVALLPVCSGLADPRLRAMLRLGLLDPNPPVRAAAIRSLCDTTDAMLWPDLVKAACETPEENLRALAIGGCVRLATREENIKLPNAQRLEAFKAILATRLSTDQKRQILAGLAEIPDGQALQLAEPLLAEAAVRNEAAQAIVKLAPVLPSAPAIAALKKVLAVTEDRPTRQVAEAALKDIEARADYITSWQVAGPYRQAGKDYAALFDIAFAPETAVSEPGAAPQTQAVNWQALPPSTDPQRPWSMDLLKALGGEQCVAYARTWVHCDREQPARLELGSDDGVKVWLNHKLVHANNVARPLQPGSDKADVVLKAGWNPLLLKVTQNNQGWEFCLRFLKPDGARIDDLQADANARP